MRARSGLTTRGTAYVRAAATANMLQTCQIERVVAPSYDTTTLVAIPGGRTVIYTGACRIWQLSNPAQVVLGEAEFVSYSTVLSIPWDTDVSQIPALHDEIEVLADPNDATMVGKRFRIQSYYKTGQMRATRTFVIDGLEKRG